jgi:hypothetical protein
MEDIEMRRYFYLPLVLILILPIALVTPIEANGEHTLDWAVDVGQEFTYALQRKIIDPAWNDYAEALLPFIAYLEEGGKATAVVTNLDEIPQQITKPAEMPLASCSLERDNDSDIILLDAKFFVVPVNDWNFLTEIDNVTGTPDLTLIDTEEEWGTSFITDFSAGGTYVTVHQELRYEKENGTLSYLRLRCSAHGNDLVDVIFVHWYPGMPTILPPELQFTTILLIGVCISIVVVVSVFIYIKRKQRKPIIQILGE